MFTGYKKKIKRKIESFCKTNYLKIDKTQMRMGNGLFNQRCHLNAVQMVKNKQCDEVYLCIILNDNEFPIVHFINKDEKGYQDNTLGWEFEKYNYYIVKKVDPSEFNDIENMLMETKRSLISLCSSNFINKLISIDEFNLGI